MERLKLVEEHFNKLISSYQVEGETYRENSFRTVLQMLKREYYKIDLPLDLKEVRELKGVGGSSISEIEHALGIKQSDRLENIAKQSTDNKNKSVKPAVNSLRDLKKLLN